MGSTMKEIVTYGIVARNMDLAKKDVKYYC